MTNRDVLCHRTQHQHTAGYAQPPHTQPASTIQYNLIQIGITYAKMLAGSKPNPLRENTTEEYMFYRWDAKAPKENSPYKYGCYISSLFGTRHWRKGTENLLWVIFLAGVTALNFIQQFDTSGPMTGRASGL